MSKTKVVTFENLAEYDQLNKDFHSGNQNTLYALAKAHTADMVADFMNGTKVVAQATNATNAITSEDSSKLGGQLPSYYAKATDIPTGSLANKSLVSESDLDSALVEKVNSASQGNHSHSNKTVLDGITSTKVSNWDSAESNAKSYTDEKIALLMENPTEAVDSIIELRDAMNDNEGVIESLTELAGSKVPTSRTVNGKALTGDISIGIADIPNLQTTLSNASSAITANTSSISGHTTRIGSLEEKVGDGFEVVTSADIQSLFP